MSATVHSLVRSDDTPVNITCNADLLCVKVYKNSQVTLVLENKSHKPLSFQLFLMGDEVQHIQLKPLQLQGPEIIELVSFPLNHAPWGFEFRIHYGFASHSHDDDYVYTLPYAKGTTFVVSQSHSKITTHHAGNLFAIDWSMPEGEPVYAARAGTVVSTYDGSNSGGMSSSVTANHIWIQHSDGTIAKYLHLAHHGVLVQEGSQVRTGQQLGLSGNTGFSSGAHLHFSVTTITPGTLYKTFNVKFKTRSGDKSLRTGRKYQHRSKSVL